MSVDSFRAANLGVIGNAIETEEVAAFPGTEEWSPERFGREQIRGLVRQIFFSSVAQPVRQVLFTGAEERTDVGQLCRQVGESLAREIKGSVAVLSRVGDEEEIGQKEIQPEPTRPARAEPGNQPLRDGARRVRSNLWLVMGGRNAQLPEDGYARAAYSRLCELRTEFDYSIVEGPPAGVSSEAAALGQLTDGIVLVLTANKTRRAVAKRIKETLEAGNTRLLGIVLDERTFPIPSALYRRL